LTQLCVSTLTQLTQDVPTIRVCQCRVVSLMVLLPMRSVKIIAWLSGNDWRCVTVWHWHWHVCRGCRNASSYVVVCHLRGSTHQPSTPETN